MNRFTLEKILTRSSAGRKLRFSAADAGYPHDPRRLRTYYAERIDGDVTYVAKIKAHSLADAESRDARQYDVPGRTVSVTNYNPARHRKGSPVSTRPLQHSAFGHHRYRHKGRKKYGVKNYPPPNPHFPTEEK